MEKRSAKKQNMFTFWIVLAIIIVLNIISVRLFFRVDMTANGLYTLSDASREIVSNLDDKVTVKAYFTEDLPAPYNGNRRLFVDILNEYKQFAGDMLQFEFIDPKGGEMEKEAQLEGVPPLEIQVVEEDKAEVKRAFMGAVIMYEDKREVLPVIQDLSTMEYDLSSSIKRLTTKGMKEIGYTIGQGESDLGQMRVAGLAIAKQYEPVSIDLSKGEEIPDNLAALLIIDPKQPFSDSALYAIDSYLMKGGRLAYFKGSVMFDETLQNPEGQLNFTKLEDMLRKYGIVVNADLVRDDLCGNVIMTRPQGQFNVQTPVQLPYLMIINNFGDENVIAQGLENVFMPFASSIDTSLAAQLGIKTEVIAMTSESSGRETSNFRIDPTRQWTPADFTENHIPVMASFYGSFKSYFRGNSRFRPAADESPQTTIVVCGSGIFMQDRFAGQSSENLALFANTVDYLADDAGLINIRAKNVSQPIIAEISDGTRNFLKYGNMVLPPLLFVLYGIIRWRLRLAKKKRLEIAG